MKRPFAAFAALTFVLMAAPHPSPAAEKPRAEQPRARPAKDALGDPATRPEAVSFTDDMDKLHQVVTLTDEQKIKLQDMRKVRDEALSKWDTGSEKSVAAIEKRRDSAKGSAAARTRKEAGESLVRLYHQRIVLAATHEKAMFAVLTPPQRIAWNAPILEEAVNAEFAELSLTEAQKQKIATICKAEAARLNAPVDPRHDTKIINAVKTRVFREVLTAKQRAEFVRSKQAEREPVKADKPRNNRNTQEKRKTR
ncbi:MAG TPA: Spy/CpxP family protein refolding chaperone [Phycisphaerae bacterium]|nr:Spy/CpxP family protein refolding chaperone [Phycisphaerae bacterium]